MHSRGVAHRDLKLENIIVNKKGHLKIIDLGFSVEVPEESSSLGKIEPQTFCGTLHFAAPEILARQPHCPKKADIWSLGVVLYRILVGTLPFAANDEITQLQCTRRGEFKRPKNISENCFKLLEAMLQPKPTKRQSASEVACNLTTAVGFCLVHREDQHL